MKESAPDQGLKAKIGREIPKMYFESYFYLKTQIWCGLQGFSYDLICKRSNECNLSSMSYELLESLAFLRNDTGRTPHEKIAKKIDWNQNDSKSTKH